MISNRIIEIIKNWFFKAWKEKLLENLYKIANYWFKLNIIVIGFVFFYNSQQTFYFIFLSSYLYMEIYKCRTQLYTKIYKSWPICIQKYTNRSKYTNARSICISKYTNAALICISKYTNKLKYIKDPFVYRNIRMHDSFVLFFYVYLYRNIQINNHRKYKIFYKTQSYKRKL